MPAVPKRLRTGAYAALGFGAGGPLLSCMHAAQLQCSCLLLVFISTDPSLALLFKLLIWRGLIVNLAAIGAKSSL